MYFVHTSFHHHTYPKFVCFFRISASHVQGLNFNNLNEVFRYLLRTAYNRMRSTFRRRDKSDRNRKAKHFAECYRISEGSGDGVWRNTKLDCKMASRSNTGLLYVQEIYRFWPFYSAKGQPRSLWQQTGGSQSLPFHFPGCKHPTSRSLASSDSLASSCNLFSSPFPPTSFFILLSVPLGPLLSSSLLDTLL